MLRSDAQFLIEPFLKAVALASGRLLMLDYDGTLAPFHDERDSAFPYPGVAATLQDIIRGGHTRVVIVSGRGVDDLIPLLGIQPIPEIWGVHGLERRRPDGTAEIAHVEQRHLEALSDARRWLEHMQVHSSAEFKTGGVAVHWRGRTGPEAEEIRMRTLMGWKPIAGLAGLALFEFDGGVEIRVPGPDKGDVVRNLLEEMGPGVAVAYMGDDSTDERAFRAIRDRGLSLRVSPQWRQTAAQLWLKPPDEVLDFLKQWLEACRGGDVTSGTMAGVAGG